MGDVRARRHSASGAEIIQRPLPYRSLSQKHIRVNHLENGLNVVWRHWIISAMWSGYLGRNWKRHGLTLGQVFWRVQSSASGQDAQSMSSISCGRKDKINDN